MMDFCPLPPIRALVSEHTINIRPGSQTLLGNLAPRGVWWIDGGLAWTVFLGQLFTKFFVEPDKGLMDITSHNHREMGIDTVRYHNTSADDFLKSNTFHFDFVYIDPSRRSKGNQKVYSLGQCDPNVLLLQEKIWETTEHLFVKASPLWITTRQ